VAVAASQDDDDDDDDEDDGGMRNDERTERAARLVLSTSISSLGIHGDVMMKRRHTHFRELTFVLDILRPTLTARIRPTSTSRWLHDPRQPHRLCHFPSSVRVVVGDVVATEID